MAGLCGFARGVLCWLPFLFPGLTIQCPKPFTEDTPEMANSFGSQANAHSRRPLVHDPPPRRRLQDRSRRRPAAVFAEDPARKPAAHRRRPRRSRPPTSKRWPSGTRRPSRAGKSPSRRAACCCRTSPACRASSIWPPCATPCRASAATPSGSTRCSRSSWSSTTRCRWMTSAAKLAFLNNTELEFERNQERYTVPPLGPEGVSTISRSCRRRPASSIRSISNTWPASCS